MKRRAPVLLVAGTLVLFMAGCFLWDRPTGDPYHDLSKADVEAQVASMSDLPVDGSDATSVIPVGAVLAYRTRHGSYGMLKVTGYTAVGPNARQKITLDWTTWDNVTGMAWTGVLLTIEGDRWCDLEYGLETGAGPECDFQWEQTSDTTRFLAPANGAIFAVQ